jgi:hypothetical protein
MPRVHHVHKCRRDQGKCHKCLSPLPVGTPYIWYKFNYGPKVKRCPKCPPKPSDLTRSPYLSTLYFCQEQLAAIDPADGPETVADNIRSVADEVRSASEIRIDAADAIEDGFGHPTYQSDELREQGETCEAAADEIESIADEVAGLDPDEYMTPDDPDGDNLISEIEGHVEEAGSKIEDCLS